MRHPRITVELAPVANDARVVTSGLSQFNAAVPTGRPWGVIHWVPEAFRRRGYGTAMLASPAVGGVLR